jgi:hypothetical protein
MGNMKDYIGLRLGSIDDQAKKPGIWALQLDVILSTPGALERLQGTNLVMIVGPVFHGRGNYCQRMLKENIANTT